MLHEAASRGDVEVLAALLAAAGSSALARTDGRGLGRTPLHSAVIHQQAAAAELLIYAQLSQPTSSPVPESSSGSQSEVPQSQEDGQDEEAELEGAAATGAPSTAAPSGLDAADSQGLTALHWAAMAGSTRVLRRLLAAGASREAAAADGMTPLHLAAKAGHVGAVQTLLEAGCSVAGE